MKAVIKPGQNGGDENEQARNRLNSLLEVLPLGRCAHVYPASQQFPITKNEVKGEPTCARGKERKKNPSLPISK